MYVERENEVECLLMLAATEPAHRPDFSRALLAADVFILGNSRAMVQST